MCVNLETLPFLEEKSQRESLVCSQILAKKYLTLKGYPPLYLSDKVFSFLLLFIAIMIIIVNISSFFKYKQLKKIDKS